LRISVQNFTQLGGGADLGTFIWSRVSDLMRFRDGFGFATHEILRNSRKKIATETLAMIREAFWKESVSEAGE
jgi:hypothetical protein